MNIDRQTTVNYSGVNTKQIAAATDTGGEVRLLYDRKTAARMLSISVRSLDYLIAGRQLDTRRIGKKVLIPRGVLSRYAQGNHYESPKDMADVA